MFKKSIFLFLLSLGVLFSNDFDDIFGDSKVTKKQVPSKKIDNNDFMDTMLSAEKHNKQSVKFNKLIKDAKDKAYNRNYSSAYKLLDRASNMNFDNRKVSSVRDDIKSSERKYIRAKREKERERREAERRRIAKQKQDQRNYQMMMASLNNTLQKQKQINQQNQAKLNALISSANKKTYSNNSYSSSNYNSYNKNKSYSSSNSSSKSTSNYNNSKSYSNSSSKYTKSSNDYQKKYEEKKKAREKEQREKKLAYEKELRAKQLAEEKRKKEEAIRAKKAERERLKKEKELKKKQEKERIEREKKEYLAKLKNGIRLAAKNCYGEHHVGGVIPKIKPRPISCIDVSFVATCKNDYTQRRNGVMTNMISNAGGCFGDTKEVKPKLGCDPKDYVVRVTNVTRCR